MRNMNRFLSILLALLLMLGFNGCQQQLGSDARTPKYVYHAGYTPKKLKNGKVTINIEVPGNIKSLTGAVKTGNKTAQFKFPIIDFLLLNKPITFSVSW